ncbi:MAG: EamA family transporter [Candidatus Wallbacteria bacterium]|nr:EamA family transporter [Candidatus Wallbacteria bacterium]MBI4866535.1 EamA family transporter [Candidatus Wallbacteria bacterium]
MADFGLLVVCILVSVSAQTLLKMGVDALGGVHLAKGVAEIWRTFTHPIIIGGFVCYFLGSYLWLAVLSRFPFSRANLYFSSNHLLTLAIAIFWFGDKFTTANMVGALMVIGGLYLVSLR